MFYRPIQILQITYMELKINLMLYIYLEVSDKYGADFTHFKLYLQVSYENNCNNKTE